MAPTNRTIIQKLDSIKSELDYIKRHMVDVDMVLSEEDKIALAKARKELKSGETVSLKELKKELGL